MDETRSHNLIMGIVNITPDSFSDGGAYLDPDLAVERALQLFDDGADIVDLGAESTRPGSRAVPAEEEWLRLGPVLRRLDAKGLSQRISIDTSKYEIMKRATELGVGYINDVSGGGGLDDDMLRGLSRVGITFIAMHKHGTPLHMQEAPLAGSQATAAVDEFYRVTLEHLKRCGFSASKVWLDPGIGFGKDDAANLKLLQQAVEQSSRCRLILGISRKSFIGRLLDIKEPIERDDASKMLELGLMLSGSITAFRTHDVKRLAVLRGLLH